MVKTLANSWTSRLVGRMAALLLVGTSVVAGSVVGTVASAVVTATPAEAATCGGNLIRHLPINNGAGTTLAWLDIYYNPSNGRNCAMTRHSDATWGKSRVTYVAIHRCQQTEPGGCTVVASDFDKDSYAYYAGPVSVWAGSHCIYARGYIQWNGIVHDREFRGACS